MAYEAEVLSPLEARAAALNARLRDAHPSEILRAAIDEYRKDGRLALVSSFGAESAVLLHMAAQIDLVADLGAVSTLAASLARRSTTASNWRPSSA